MTKYSQEELDSIFSALSDPTRRTMLERLLDGEQTVGALAESFDFALPTISRHIRVLEEAGLLTRKREGRLHYMSLNAVQIKKASTYLTHYQAFWQETFELLDDYLEQQSPTDESDDPTESAT